MKAYGGMDIKIQVFLTFALVGGEWSALCLGRFTPGKEPRGTLWIGGLVGPRTSLDDVEKRKFLTLPGLELRSYMVSIFPKSFSIPLVAYFHKDILKLDCCCPSGRMMYFTLKLSSRDHDPCCRGR
jgi:hypothetical protein